MNFFGNSVEILTAQERELRRQIRLRVVWGSFALGVLWGIYYYFSESSAAAEYCRQLGRAYPCAGMQRGNLLAPFTFWLFTVPIGWLASWPVADYLRRGQGIEKQKILHDDD